MSQSRVRREAADSLTGLLLPLADRNLLLPNVVVAELIPYRAPTPFEGMPGWVLGQVAWRELRLPLLSFEAVCGGRPVLGAAPRIAVLNALGGRAQVKFIALLVQGIPRSVRLDTDLARSTGALHPLELDAVQVGEIEARIPDLVGLEEKLAQAGLL
ncbi:chemotaxis protein CheW [Stutzerimonas tarimensis]|uniref:Chemotaxis protein CheW n=1 Tax=Stutzerimonas tarimensis TaxID=1507735 RepID=A0ABV7T6K4_9GAMM